VSTPPSLPPIDLRPISLTGLTLGGRYCIEHRVGEGGMAHLYFARDLKSNSEIAIKVLLPQLESDPESVARLRREAVIAARLEHPNVCPITDMGETPEGQSNRSHAFAVHRHFLLCQAWW
jgi:serine/threonine-protein kinase